MNDTLLQLAQKSLRVTLGATATLIETLQDPQQREANLSKLRTELSQLTEEWEVKGETAEREARNFVDTIVSQASSRASSTDAPVSSTVSTLASPVASADVQQDLQELTDQIAALRAELERLRAQDS